MHNPRNNRLPTERERESRRRLVLPRNKREKIAKKFVADLLPFRAPDSFSFSPIALADVDGHVASDEFLRRARQRMCPAGSGFGQFERWEWIWTLLKRSRCTVSFPLYLYTNYCSSTGRVDCCHRLLPLAMIAVEDQARQKHSKST